MYIYIYIYKLVPSTPTFKTGSTPLPATDNFSSSLEWNGTVVRPAQYRGQR